MLVIDFVSKGRGWRQAGATTFLFSIVVAKLALPFQSKLPACRQAGETTIGICFVGQGFEPYKIANLKVCPTIHNPKFIIYNSSLIIHNPTFAFHHP